jgi:hypothetical protein
VAIVVVDSELTPTPPRRRHPRHRATAHTLTRLTRAPAHSLRTTSHTHNTQQACKHIVLKLNTFQQSEAPHNEHRHNDGVL